MKRIQVSTKYLLLALVSFLILSLLLAVSLGSVPISLEDTYRVILSRLGLVGDRGLSQSVMAIVWNMRLPRVLLGMVVGAGLAVGGSVMQSTVNNPISEPYLLGISSGATFGASLMIVLGLGTMVSLGAFLGALIATLMVLLLASIQKEMTRVSLILSGMLVNALFIAFANFTISVGATADSVVMIKFWTMGSLASATWADLPFPSLLVTCFLLFFWSQYRVFNAMIMGDKTAVSLGISLTFYRRLYISLIAAMTAVLVASCGIIGFVGLITPHMARGLVGSNHRRILPVAACLGMLLLIWSDVLARVLIKNVELPIGIFTALVGAPFFIYIVAKYQKGVRA